MTKLTEAIFSMQCSFIAKNAAAWAGDILTLPENYNREADPKTVARFTDEMRGRLDRLDEWAGREASPHNKAQRRSALVDVPAEPVCTVALIGAAGFRWLVPHPINAVDHLPVGTPLYTSPPLSREGEDTAEVIAALEFVALWAWREDPPAAARNLSDGERLSAIKYHPTIKALAATRSGSAIASSGDQS